MWAKDWVYLDYLMSISSSETLKGLFLLSKHFEEPPNLSLVAKPLVAEGGQLKGASTFADGCESFARCRANWF